MKIFTRIALIIALLFGASLTGCLFPYQYDRCDNGYSAYDADVDFGYTKGSSWDYDSVDYCDQNGFLLAGYT